MKNLLPFLSLFFFCNFLLAQSAFITTWKTDNTGTSNSTSITIPTFGTGYNYDVDWDNDGVFDQLGITGDVTHDFGSVGTYTIRIQGDFPRIYFNEGGDCLKILSVNQWGNLQWESMGRAFMGARNLEVDATDAPDLSMVTDISYMFYDADRLNQDINHWDVSNVTDMSWLFYEARLFDKPLDNWDVSNVTNMNAMFYVTVRFNQPIGNWDVSNVTDLGYMFKQARLFNQPLNDWDVSKVTNMNSMFRNARDFNQPLDNWSVSDTTSRDRAFKYAASFNQDIRSWNISEETRMRNLFEGATGLSITKYDSLLIYWDQTGVEDIFFGFNDSISYCNGSTARQNLINKGWTMNNDILDCQGTMYYPDVDGDGFGDYSAPSDLFGSVPFGHVLNNSDCDDSNPNVIPSNTDMDGDNVVDCLDNCPNLSNPNQINADGDAFGDACDCDDNNPNDINLIINDNPIATGNYISNNYITSEGLVPPTNTVDFQAVESITLGVNFLAQEGSNFIAHLENCSVPPTPLTENTNEDAFFINKKNKIPNDNILDVSPNPFQSRADVVINLQKDEILDLAIYDMMGNQLEKFIDYQSTIAGTYHFKIDGEKWQAGSITSCFAPKIKRLLRRFF